MSTIRSEVDGNDEVDTTAEVTSDGGNISTGELHCSTIASNVGDRESLERDASVLAESIIRARTSNELTDSKISPRNNDSSNVNDCVQVAGVPVGLRWPSTVEVMPSLPKDVLQNDSSQHSMPSLLQRRSTVSTMSAGPSERMMDTSTSMELDEPSTYLSKPGAAPIVAFPVPLEIEPVEAVPVSYVEQDATDTLPASNRKRLVVLLSFVIAIIIIASAVIGGVCASDMCSSDGGTLKKSFDDGNNNSAPSPEIFNRETSLYEYINNVTLTETTFTPYQNDSIPEKQALNWIIELDPLQLTVQVDSFRIRQRYALLTFWFYSAYNEAWINSTGWLTFDDECTWFGISCTEIEYGSDRGFQNTVTSIKLPYNGIKGIIPADLGILSQLEVFCLNGNKISGTIPESIGHWTDLERLELQFNGVMYGQLPNTIGNLHRLLYADFSSNEFTGQLPSSIGNWSSITHLDFSNNPLNSTLPSSVGLWTNLENISFMMTEGNMHGSLPQSIGSWKNIRELYLIGNAFSGDLPSTLYTWTELSIIDLSFNDFSGTIPLGVLNWTNVEYVNLVANNFTGTIPDGICDGPKLSMLEADCLFNITCKCCTLCI
jgi:Leucine-rich repeat (LRR) protein